MRTAKQHPVISIVIPCLDEEDYVGKLLNDLAHQHGAAAFEVIVVDSDSEDNTIDVAKEFADALPLTVIELEERGVSRARNAGADAASGEWLFFLDAKVRIDPEYIRKVFNTLHTHQADFGTSSFNTKSWHPFDKIFFWLWSRGFWYSYRKGEYLMNGSTMFIKRDLHVQNGGFDQNIEIGQDIDYARRLIEYSTNGVFVPAKMHLSNRRLVHRGRINAVLMMLNWNNLVPRRVGEYVTRGYHKRYDKPPFWRRIVRYVFNLAFFVAIIATAYVISV